MKDLRKKGKREITKAVRKPKKVRAGLNGMLSGILGGPEILVQKGEK